MDKSSEDTFVSRITEHVGAIAEICIAHGVTIESIKFLWLSYETIDGGRVVQHTGYKIEELDTVIRR